MRQARAIGAAALGILIALAGTPVGAPALAQGCSTVCSDYYDGECIAHTTTCPGSAPSASGGAPHYGAIAYGATSKAWGYSYRWGSEAKAEAVAMQTCGQHGDDCKVAVWFKTQCGPVVSEHRHGCLLGSWRQQEGGGQRGGEAVHGRRRWQHGLRLPDRLLLSN